MCDEGTYVIGWAVKAYDGFKGVDHYGLGGIRIYCDAIGDVRKFNENQVQNQRRDGKWVQPTYEGVNSLQNHNLFCSVSFSYDEDGDVGIDGLRVKKCTIKILKYLTGEWSSIISSYGTPALKYEVEKVQFRREATSSSYEELDTKSSEFIFGHELDVNYF